MLGFIARLLGVSCQGDMCLLWVVHVMLGFVVGVLYVCYVLGIPCGIVNCWFLVR